MQNKNKRVFKFVLTGGSCGGKTTTTRVLKDKLEKLGYNVFIIPEISTELDLKGYTLEKIGKRKMAGNDSSLANCKRRYYI